MSLRLLFQRWWVIRVITTITLPVSHLSCVQLVGIQNIFLSPIHKLHQLINIVINISSKTEYNFCYLIGFYALRVQQMSVGEGE